MEAPARRATTCIYFAAERSPLGEPILVLDGEGRGPVNDLCVPSDVAPSYAPPGAALVSATVLGIPPLDDDGLEAAVREQLRGWFGAQVDGWRRLAVYRIPFACRRSHRRSSPGPAPGTPARRALRVRRPSRHGLHPGAMVSGPRAAAAVRGIDSGPFCGLCGEAGPAARSGLTQRDARRITASTIASPARIASRAL